MRKKIFGGLAVISFLACTSVSAIAQGVDRTQAPIEQAEFLEGGDGASSFLGVLIGLLILVGVGLVIVADADEEPTSP